MKKNIQRGQTGRFRHALSALLPLLLLWPSTHPPALAEAQVSTPIETAWYFYRQAQDIGALKAPHQRPATAPPPPPIGPESGLQVEETRPSWARESVAQVWALLANKGPAEHMPTLYHDALHTWWRDGAAKALPLLSTSALLALHPANETQRDDAAQAWMLRAMLEFGLGHEEAARSTMTLAVDALPQSASAWQFLGTILQAQKGTGSELQVLLAFQNARDLQTPASTSDPFLAEARAFLLSRLGELFYRLKQPMPAQEHWTQAAQAYEALAFQTKLRHHTTNAIKAASNAAFTQADLDQYSQAAATLSRAIELSRALIERDPTMEAQSDVANLLRAQSDFFIRLGKPCERKRVRREALEILQELAELDPLLYQFQLNQLDRHKLTLTSEDKDCEGRAFPVKLTIDELPRLPTRQELADTLVTQWDSSIRIWQDYSRFLMQEGLKGDASRAAQWSLRVLDIQLRMDRATPARYRLDVARTLMRIGSLHQMAGHRELALKSYQFAQAYWDPATQAQPPHPLSNDIRRILDKRIALLASNL